MRDELIWRGRLLDKYDMLHQGPPGEARKLIENAPAVDAVPICGMRIDTMYINTETNEATVQILAGGQAIRLKGQGKIKKREAISWQAKREKR